MSGEQLDWIRALRLLRVIRLLKVIRSLPQLFVIVQGLIKGMESIMYISVLLFLVYYVYAVLGVISFKNDDPWHFKDIRTAGITLFRISTLDSWAEIMLLNIKGCSEYGYNPVPWDGTLFQIGQDFDYSLAEDELCNGQRSLSTPSGVAVAFFCSFVVLSSFMMLSLFIGVVASSMLLAQEEEYYRRAVSKEVKSIQKRHKVRQDQVAAYRTVFDAIDTDKSGLIDQVYLSPIYSSPI